MVLPEGIPQWVGKWQTWVMFAEALLILGLLAT